MREGPEDREIYGQYIFTLVHTHMIIIYITVYDRFSFCFK